MKRVHENFFLWRFDCSSLAEPQCCIFLQNCFAITSTVAHSPLPCSTTYHIMAHDEVLQKAEINHLKIFHAMNSSYVNPDFFISDGKIFVFRFLFVWLGFFASIIFKCSENCAGLDCLGEPSWWKQNY